MAHRLPTKLGISALALLLLASAAVSAQEDPTAVTWVNQQNILVSGNTLTENCNGCGKSGAESQETIPAGDGYFDFTVGAKDVFAVGMGSGPASTNADSIEFSLRFNGAGSAEVRESGRYITDTRYDIGDRFRVAVENGAVNYYMFGKGRNPVLIHSNKTPALSYPVKIEAVFLGAKSSITDALAKVLGNRGLSSNTQAPAGSPTVNLTFTNVNNAVVQGNSLISSTAGQNAGAQSVEALSGDGFVEFTAVETNTMRAAGLDHQNSNNTLQDIDYAIVLREAVEPGAQPVAEVWENGAYVSDTPYGSGDRFRIAVEGGKVKYYKYVNNQLVEIPGKNSAVSSFPLHLDAALYSEQASIADVKGARQN
jgi:hypothetical protein